MSICLLMLQSGSYLTVWGPDTKECQEVVWCFTFHCWGLQIQRLHFLKGCVVGGLSAPILYVRFWRVAFLTRRHWLNIEDCFGAEASFCTDYSFITGRKLVTVQWRMVADGHHFFQAIRVNITDSTSLLVGDTEDPVSLEWHVCPRCIFKIMRKYQTNQGRGTFSKTTGLNT